MISSRNLMRGDLVYCKRCGGNKVERVDAIENGKIKLEFCATYTYEGTLEPIPITAETLKANGFVFRENISAWWHINPKDSFFSDFELSEMDGFYMLNGFAFAEIRFIHELQHAL